MVGKHEPRFRRTATVSTFCSTTIFTIYLTRKDLTVTSRVPPVSDPDGTIQIKGGAGAGSGF